MMEFVFDYFWYIVFGYLAIGVICAFCEVTKLVGEEGWRYRSIEGLIFYSFVSVMCTIFGGVWVVLNIPGLTIGTIGWLHSYSVNKYKEGYRSYRGSYEQERYR